MPSSPRKRKAAYHANVTIIKPEHQDDLIARSEAGEPDARQVVEALIGYLRYSREGLKCACCHHRFKPKEEPGAIAALTMDDMRVTAPVRAVAFGICFTCAAKDDLAANVYQMVSGMFPSGDCQLVSKPGRA